MIISIVGTGLIGGSVAISLKEKNFAEKIIGVDKNQLHQKKAVEKNLVDEVLPLEAAIKQSDVIILAVPVDVIKELLSPILDRIGSKVLIEMGSTKKQILDSVKDHPNRGRLVSVHPMAGTEYSGPDAAIPNLFKGKVMIFCDATDSDDDAYDIAENVIDQLDMKTVFMEAREHDTHTAYVSHISHITSFALALTVLEKEKSQGRIFELASSGFESTVRLAKSSAEMWVPIFKQNQENILEVLEEHIKQLQQFYDAIAGGNTETINKLIKKSNKIKRILK